MVFSSPVFLFVFLPAVLVLYFAAIRFVPVLKNPLLFAASVLFYSWGEPKYFFLMLCSICVNYCLGIFLENRKNQNARRACVVFAAVFNLGILFVFKYFGFVMENIGSLLKMEFKVKALLLPVGISFYTFQTLSYVIDVYRSKVSAQRNFVSFGLYVSLFPQLIAGPIVRYSDIEKQLGNTTLTSENLYLGCRRFMIGFAKKILVADQLAVYADAVFARDGISFAPAILGAVAYSLQIFFDFSGYSDMAIGLGKIFGFDFLENFNFPYISSSVKEFWRRWHISLSGWFKDYVYIPLGGSRVSVGRTYFNLFVVFMCTGIWHGASWNFVFWGLYYAVFLILERLFLGKSLERIPAFLRHVYLLAVIIVGWVFFRAENLSRAVIYLSNICNFAPDMYKSVVVIFDRQFWFCLAAGIFFSVPLAKKIDEKLAGTRFALAADLFVLGVFGVAVCYLVGKGFSPFLYFRF